MKVFINSFVFLVSLLQTTLSSSNTCLNTPGRDDLYFIRDDYQHTISHSAYHLSKWHYHTSKHTDTRFGNVPYLGPRRDLLKQLFANWAGWCDDNNIKYIIGHGTLLGWKWNERILLWDDDMDVIVDQPTFAYLLQYNNTVIRGRYLLDLNPDYIYRGYGGYNTIDGEFIDLETGVYIDITILTHTLHNINTTKSRMVSETENCFENCLEDKSVHRYAYDIIYPFRRAKLEGIETWIPNKPEEALDQEYTIKARTIPEFTAYEWTPPEGWVWEPEGPKVIERPVRPPRGFPTDKYIKYEFSNEINDFYVKEESPKQTIYTIETITKKDSLPNNNVETETLPINVEKFPENTFESIHTYINTLLPLKTYNEILFHAKQGK